jgi:uncharacterized Ntn-hydrolase superfamily protein
MMNRTYIAPAKKISLLIAVAIFGLFSCNQKIEDSEGNLGTNPDTSRDHEGDTFSIVAYDKTTGQVGGAACSCVSYANGIDFLSDLITDGTSNPDNIVGAIHSQAAYNASTQTFARNRMLAGDTPQQIIDATVAADGSSASRQYGVVGVDVPGAAGFTGSSNGNYGNDQQGDNAFYTYSIQGNILDVANGQDLLDDMEAIFNNTDGTLGDKLMAALQAAKRVGGDNRCQSRGNSGRTAFVQVLSPGETSPGLIYDVGDNTSAVADYIEPIDVLQCMYDIGENTPYCRQTVSTFPYAMNFEQSTWEQEVATCNINSSWIRSRFGSPSADTGPSGANQGTLYTFVEASNIDGQGTSPRDAYIGSPCFVIPSNATANFTFDYHMYGADMGTLSLTASNDGGNNWTTLWSRTGDQGNTWFNDESVNISSFAGSTVKFRFEARMGNGFRSDMAIDDIQIDVTPLGTCSNVTQFNSGSWSNGTPTLSSTVILNSNYDTSVHGSFDACELTISNSTSLTVQPNDYVRVNGDITVNGDLIIEHQGSLVQVEGSASVTKGPSGVINVKVTTPVLEPRDLMLMGSPMSAETREDVYTNAFLVLNHTPTNFLPHPLVPAGGTNFADDNGDFWNEHSGAITIGEGYIVRPQTGYSHPNTESFDMTYTLGTLNNGDVTNAVVFNNLTDNPDGTPNMLANPYASAISADDFISANPLINEIYFWEHLTPPSANFPGANPGMNFSMEDLSMYNLSGGNAAGNDPGTSTEPNGVISTAQGFAVKVFGSGNVTFTNDMRLTSGNTTLRQNADPSEIDRVWLKVTNDTYGMGSNTMVAFNPIATPGVDPGYDSERISTIISLYSHLEDGSQELGIQTREAFEDNIKIAMGFATIVDAEEQYTITLADLEGDAVSNATVLLYDTYENTVTNLNQEAYTFRSNKGTFNGRFVLQFKNEQILGTPETALENITLFPNPTSNLLRINSPQLQIEKLILYDLQGRKVQQLNVEDPTQYQLDLSTLKTAIYFVEIHTENGVITKRVIKK